MEGSQTPYRDDQLQVWQEMHQKNWEHYLILKGKNYDGTYQVDSAISKQSWTTQ